MTYGGIDITSHTRQYICDTWHKISPKILKHYFTNLNLLDMVDQIPPYLKILTKSGEFEAAVELIWKFDMQDQELDWLPIVKYLLVSWYIWYFVTLL